MQELQSHHPQQMEAQGLLLLQMSRRAIASLGAGSLVSPGLVDQASLGCPSMMALSHEKQALAPCFLLEAMVSLLNLLTFSGFLGRVGY